MLLNIDLSKDMALILRIILVLSTCLCNDITFRHPNPNHKPSETTVKHDSTITGFASRYVPATHKMVVYWMSLFDIYVSLCSLIQSNSHPLSSYRWMVIKSVDTPTITHTVLACVALNCAAAYLRMMCYRALGKHFTFEFTIHEDHKLCTSGPYSVVRHPSYTAILICQLCTWFMFFGSGSAWVSSHAGTTYVGQAVMTYWVTMLCLVVVAMFKRMPLEDEALKEMSGEEWVEWYKKVPYKLIPYIY